MIDLYNKPVTDFIFMISGEAEIFSRNFLRY